MATEQAPDLGHHLARGYRLATEEERAAIGADDGTWIKARPLGAALVPPFGFVTGDGSHGRLDEPDEYRCGRCGGQRDRIHTPERDDPEATVPGLCPRCHPRLRTTASGGTL